MNTPKIAVVGSINMDLVTTAERFPQPGETLLGQHFAQFIGGKGANQAVAAARLGAQVSLIGAVGQDSNGDALLAALAKENIDLATVKRTDQAASGMANITVAQGENHIIVVSGANFCVTADDVLAAETVIAAADIVMAQLELPLQAVQAAAELAQKHGKPFILNPAPAQKLPEKLLRQTTLLTPNAYELAATLALPADTPPEQLLAAAPCPVVMTLGSQGAVFRDEQGRLGQQSAYPVQAVDTTGAGDTFNGALARYWLLGLDEAVKHACAAAALSVQKHGAQSGMPTEAELAAFLAAR